MISGFEPSSKDRIESNPETHMYTFYNIAMEYIGFNTQKEPLDDKRVRQAITHIFDKEAVINGIYSGTGRTLEGPLQPEVLGYDEDIEGLGCDVERARELMAEAGYEDGFEISIITNDASERWIWLSTSRKRFRKSMWMLQWTNLNGALIWKRRAPGTMTSSYSAGQTQPEIRTMDYGPLPLIDDG